MSLIVLLDAGPLGMVTNPRGSQEADACNKWLESLLTKGAQVIIPEIADYELRRELLRADKKPGIKRLDELKKAISYLPINTNTMLKASEFWAEARNRGKQTADDKALDADMILSAQAVLIKKTEDDVIIATTNIDHLSLFAKASKWNEIQFV